MARYLTVPPALVDGESAVTTSPEDLDEWFLDAAKAWLQGAADGDVIEIKAVEMTDAEFEALPEL